MASGILSKPYPSRPLSSASPSLRTHSCLRPALSRRCLYLSRLRPSVVTRHSSLLSPALATSSAPSVTACDPSIHSDVCASPQNDTSQQFFPNVSNPEPRVHGSLNAARETTTDRSSADPRLDSSLNADQETTLESSSVGQSHSGSALSFEQDSGADGFRYREPTEYDFEIYASNSMEGFVQPPPPLPRFGAVFEDYWGEVIGEDTRPKGDEASIRIRNGLLKYLEGLKEAEDKENKAKPRSLFSGSRASNRSRPIQSYSDYLAQKEREAAKEREASAVSQSSSQLTSGSGEILAMVEKPTENVAASGERTVPRDSEVPTILPRSRVDDGRPAERRIGRLDRLPSTSVARDSVAGARANLTETNTISGDTVSSPGYDDRDAGLSGRDDMLVRNNAGSPREGYSPRYSGHRDTSVTSSTSSNSVSSAAWFRDKNSTFSRDRSTDSNTLNELDNRETYDVTGRPITPRLENTNVGGEDVGSTLDTEIVGNAFADKPVDSLERSKSSLDSKPRERVADNRFLEGRWYGAGVEEKKRAIKPAEGSWRRNRFGEVEPAVNTVGRILSDDGFRDAKSSDRSVEDRLLGEKFESVKPADKLVEEKTAVDRFGQAESSGTPMQDRWTGDKLGNVERTGDTGSGNLDYSFGKSSLPESRTSKTVSNLVPEPLEIVVDSEGTDRLIGNKKAGWEMNSISTARLLNSSSVDNSMDSEPRELEVHAASSSDLQGSSTMNADRLVSTYTHNDSMEAATRHFSKENKVSYFPAVRDVVLGVVISGSDEKLELEIGAEQSGLVLSKDVRPFLNTNLENSFLELPPMDESQKLEGFVAPLGQSLIVKDRTAYNGASPVSSIMDCGTVVTAEVQGLSLGDGRAILSTRPPAQRMAWHRIKQLMQLGEAVNTQIVQYNDGGVLGFVEGVRSFLPRSELLQRPENTMALSRYIGRTLPVVILQAEEETGNMIISELLAWKRKNLQLGTVHDATVTRVYPYGMQVEVDNTRLRGFVHISNISKEYVKKVEDLFTVGEKVKVMLIRGRDVHQISFSIGELESDRGLILRNKERVFLEAEKMARQFQDNLSEDDRQLFGQTVKGSEVKFDGPTIANMNWLHLGNEESL